MEEKKEVSAELRKFLDGIWLEAEAKVTQAKQHYESGRRDCECGVYDKWYRYPRARTAVPTTWAGWPGTQR